MCALTNLAHLDWLRATVAQPEQQGHTTYRLGKEPSIGVLWTYAEPNPDGSYRHVGGGSYDEASDTWGQGAFNADDVTRAAVVYLRHWQATGDSDSDASYWLARTIWALGEGYAAFADSDPEFAGFLRRRLELAVEAVDRQSLDTYGKYLHINSQKTPAWLIADGADATAEAILGLFAYVDAGGSNDARRTLSRLAEGVAALRDGDAQTWPFGAVRPGNESASLGPARPGSGPTPVVANS